MSERTENKYTPFDHIWSGSTTGMVRGRSEKFCLLAAQRNEIVGILTTSTWRHCDVCFNPLCRLLSIDCGSAFTRV